MRVLIGTHGTGKTTLLRAISEKRPQMFVTDGVSRPITEIRKDFGLDQRTGQAFMNHITEWTWKNTIDQKNYFSTRSVIDAYVYAKVFGWEDLAEKSLKVFLDSDYSKVKYYYIPIEFELEDDGMRFQDKDLQTDVDNLMIEFIEKYKLDVLRVTGTVEERVNIILKN